MSALRILCCSLALQGTLNWGIIHLMTIKRKKSDASHFLAKLVGELTLASLLLAIRQGEAMTQVEFSKMLKVSKQYLCDVERGRRMISPKAAAGFAKRLGYSPEHFIRLCLQDMINRDGLKFVIDVKKAA
jgi:DNA-binding transcriptional regulator YiaG